jgi:hypothetical protein
MSCVLCVTSYIDRRIFVLKFKNGQPGRQKSSNKYVRRLISKRRVKVSVTRSPVGYDTSLQGQHLATKRKKHCSQNQKAVFFIITLIDDKKSAHRSPV